jgi:hypothetical protein
LMRNGSRTPSARFESTPSPMLTGCTPTSSPAKPQKGRTARADTHRNPKIVPAHLLIQGVARIIDLRSESAVGADLSAPSLRRHPRAVYAACVECSLDPTNPDWLRGDPR